MKKQSKFDLVYTYNNYLSFIRNKCLPIKQMDLDAHDPETGYIGKFGGLDYYVLISDK